MANFSYKNKKFPIKAGPSILLAITISFLMSFSAMYFLKDEKEFLNLDNFTVEDIEYEFQTVLEQSNFDQIQVIAETETETCEYFAQSGSFRSLEAAQSQLKELEKVGYQPKIENVVSTNNYNFKVIVGPFENRSQTNNARENLRRLNMDSLEIRNCKKITDEPS